MRAMTWCMSTLLAVVLATGCKSESQPAAPAPVASAPAGQAKAPEDKAKPPAPAKKKEAATAKAVADPAKKPVAPKKPAVEPAKVAEPAKPAVEPNKTPVASDAAVTVPDNVLVFGGIRSLDDLSARVTTVANEVQPMPGLSAMLAGGLAKGLGLSGIEWLDGSKPIVFAVSNPKEGGMPFVVVLPMRSKEAFEGALPAEREAGVDGAAFKYKQGSKDTYVSYAGDRVVISEDKNAAERLRGFVDGGLATYAPQSTLEVTFSVANATRIFAAELAAARAELAKSVEAGTAGSPFADTAGAVGKELEWLFDVLPQLDSLTFAIRLEGDHVMLPVTVHAKKGTEVAALFGEASGRSLTLLDYVPASSYLVLGASLDPVKVGRWTELGFSMAIEALKLGEEDGTRLLSLVNAASALETGETVVAFHKDGAAALSLLALTGTTDGAKLREASFALYDMLWTKGIEYMKAEKGPDADLKLDLSTFPKTIETLAMVTEPVGVTLALATEVRGDATVDALTIGIDYTKLVATTGKPEDAAIVKTLFGERVVIALGHGKERRALAIGPDAKQRVTDVIEGKKGAPSAALRTSLAHAVPGSSFLLFISAIEGLKAFASIPDLAPMAARIAVMNAPNGAAISVGSVSGGGLRTVIDIPVSHVKQLMTLKP